MFGNEHDLGAAPLVMVVVYLLVLLVLGAAGYMRSRQSEEDYYLAGRDQGWFVSGLTIIATFFSSFAFLGASAAVYREGLVFTLFALNLPLSGASIYLLGARIRKIGYERGFVTPADMVADYYQSPIALRLLVALAGYLYAVPYVMMQIKAGGEVSAVMFGGEELSLGLLGTYNAFQSGAVVLAAITMLYIMVGGMRSVAWTDVLQGCLLIGGMLLGGVAVISAFGGVRGFGQALSELPASSLTAPGTTGRYPWSKMLTICMFASVGSLVQPAQWMRFYAARSGRALKRSALLFALTLPVCFLLGVMLVGIGGQLLYPLVGEGLDASPPPQVGEFDRILVVVLTDQLPALFGVTVGAALASLVIVAIMAASMSTADSNLHAMSAVAVRDVYDRFLRPQSTQRERLWVGRGVIVLTTIAALILVLRSSGEPQATSTFDFMHMIALLGFVAIGFSVQLLPLAIDILYLRRGTAAGAAWGLAAGLFGAFLFSPLFGPFAELLQAVPVAGDVARAVQACGGGLPMDSTAWGLLFNVPVFVLVSLVTCKVPDKTRAEYAKMVGA
ncbi:MAG: sodium:solute symporter [Pirellulaceae bacterium]